MDYLGLKHFHMGCAVFSGSLFLLRGVWMLRASTMLQQRGRTQGQRLAAFAGALALFAYIVTVAITKRTFP
jgi:uncharacterized membrane protein SirB2